MEGFERLQERELPTSSKCLQRERRGDPNFGHFIT